MSLLEKAKVAAEKARVAAQQGVHQGQAKLDAMQAKRRAEALLRELGAAYYSEQRRGGSHDAVDSALAALDAHAAEHGGIDTTAHSEGDSSM